MQKLPEGNTLLVLYPSLFPLCFAKISRETQAMKTTETSFKYLKAEIIYILLYKIDQFYQKIVKYNPQSITTLAHSISINSLT